MAFIDLIFRGLCGSVLMADPVVPGAMVAQEGLAEVTILIGQIVHVEQAKGVLEAVRERRDREGRPLR
jgi:hypothetical protein